jgi:hypothetical protein
MLEQSGIRGNLFMKAWQVIVSFQCFFTFILMGLIWCVQLVNYPLFPWIDKDKFCRFEKEHQKRISIIVVPLMLLECFFAVLMLTLARNSFDKKIAFILFGLLLLIWISTFCLQVPEHLELSNGFNLKSVKKLVLTNWIRTAAWTLRSLLLLWMLLRL